MFGAWGEIEHLRYDLKSVIVGGQGLLKVGPQPKKHWLCVFPTTSVFEQIVDRVPQILIDIYNFSNKELLLYWAKKSTCMFNSIDGPHDDISNWSLNVNVFMITNITNILLVNVCLARYYSWKWGTNCYQWYMVGGVVVPQNMSLSDMTW